MIKFNDADLDLFISVLRMSDVFSKQVAEGLHHLKLSKPQFDILYLISRSDKKRETLTSVVKENQLSKSNVSSILTRLEEKGYITREHDKADRRVIWLNTTPKAESLIEKFVPPYRTQIKELLANVKPSLKEEFYAVTEKIRDKLLE